MNINNFFKSLFMKSTSKNSNKISVNGQKFQGNSITITKDGVFIDGELQSSTLDPNIEIHIYGDVDKLESGSGNVTVKGYVNYVSTGSGDVNCGDVTGSIKTGSGDVDCGKVTGNINTGSGDVNHR